MATFKVGQRVRIVARGRGEPNYPQLLNAETIITSGPMPSYPRGPYYRTAAPDAVPGAQGVYEDCLAPLTDPKADAFLESIRQLKPLTVRETA